MDANQDRAIGGFKNGNGRRGATMRDIRRVTPTRRRVLTTTGAVATSLAAPMVVGMGTARADYPDRPVKVVVANTPGGPSDIVGRIVTAALDQSTGKTFIIENRGGAGGNIGMEYVARSNPHGYTILLATNAFSVNYGRGLLEWLSEIGDQNSLPMSRSIEYGPPPRINMMRKSAAHITVNSAPPPWALKNQPFGNCTLNVMTSNSIKSNSANGRVRKPIVIQMPPTNSRNMMRYAIGSAGSIPRRASTFAATPCAPNTRPGVRQ